MLDELDEWIASYQAAQRQRHNHFLKAFKDELVKRTQQQRRDRLDQINPPQVQGMALAAKVGRCRTAAKHRKES